MLSTTIALSVILGFVCTEFTGLLTGGLVSSGYLAYYFQEPTRMVSTLLVSILICLLVKALKCVMILYGRRRFMVTVVMSILAVHLIESFYYYGASINMDLRIIGYIIPGLIANDMEKQGILKTLGVVIVLTLVLRLLILLGV
ncbi:MAG: poly-gamma-glutamate biosynthesis protein PgsC [Spirochaetales bacterium]|nr:poly-gamma-glutamate biosynthesis protein PgsC [Candidatus Physcosoma equi]